jgi:hypothetical protein
MYVEKEYIFIYEKTIFNMNYLERILMKENFINK